MQARTDWTYSSRSRSWKQRRKRHGALYAWTWLFGLLLGAAGIGALLWQLRDGVQTFVANGSSAGSGAASPEAGAAQWQQVVLNSLETSAQQVGVGQITQAETTVDQAAALLAAERVKSEQSGPAFFQLASAGLDRVWSQQPNDDRLFEHVTQARIALAMLRVAGNGPPPGSRESSSAVSSSPANARGGNAPPASAAKPAAAHPDISSDIKKGMSTDASAAANIGTRPGKSVAVRATRKIAANSVFNPAALGGDYLDATRMPRAAEILLPPASQSLEDNVRVENLTIAGASQTLDAIRWSNVTFVGTRLRYGTGPLALENVHFIGCTFEFPTDVRGARLANAIALGQTSFTSD